MPSFPDLESPLCSEVVELRLAAERDIPEILIAYQDDPTLHRRLGLDRPPSGAELGRRTEEEAERRATGDGVRFTLVRPGEDVCQGQLSVQRVDWAHRRGEIGMWVASQARGQGLGAAALRLVAGWLFDVCGLARVELMTEPDNCAMIAAARAAGATEEGVLHSYLRERTGRVDVTVFSILPADLGAA